MLRRVAASLAMQAAALGVSFADRFVLVGIMLRAWGTDLYSDWATLLAAAGLVTLGELGLNVYFGNHWQKAHADGDESRFRRLIGLSLSAYAVVGTGLAAIILFIIATTDLDVAFSLQAMSGGEAVVVFGLLAGVALLRVLRGSISQIYRGRGDFTIGLGVDLIPVASGVIVVGLAVAMGAGPVAAALIYVAVDVFCGWSVMLWDQGRRYGSLGYVPARPTGSELKDVVSKVGGYAILQGTPVAWLQGPVLMIGMLGFSGPGLVSFILTRTLVNLTRQIATMMTLSVGVEIAAAQHAGDTAAAARMLPEFGQFLSGVVGTMVGGLVIFAALLMTLWSGRPELIDLGLLLWLLAPAILATPALPLAAVMNYVNRPEAAAAAGLVQLAVGLAAAFLLAAPYGLLGIAAGLAIGEAIALGGVLPVLARRWIPLCGGYLRYFASCALAFTFAAGWSAGAGWAACWLVSPTILVTTAVAVLIWGLCGALPALYMSAPGRYRLLIQGRLASAVRI